MAPIKLRELIKQIRASKTAAHEREVITKECALIRTSFRDEDNEFRCRNVAKLLYIHMLGYPAHFGQLECLKLVASPRFVDKRIGYLGVSVLLDEKAEIGLLVTNCLKNDMSSTNQYIVGLALSTLGSIASPEMCRDLAAEVEKLLKSSNAFVRKKAALCAVRIVRKVPELVENFVPGTRALLGERNHAVLLTGVTLINEMCNVSHESLGHFRKLVPHLVKILKALQMSGASAEHDVGGITDPFLQVKILRLLRLLGKDDPEASEAMNDLLAQIATNTDTVKNVGNSILYETVLCIMDIKSESGLRVLAVNLLGRFLGNVDKNIRYVALNTLLKTVHADQTSVQRHRNTILECLKDTDITIRRRAVELLFALVNQGNIRVLAKELLEFLDTCEIEFKSFMTTELFRIAEKFSPSRRWHIDTILRVLTTAGSYVREDAVSSFVSLVSQSPELQGYAVLKLYQAVSADVIQQPLVQVALWCIGEYGNLLVSGEPTTEEPPIDIPEVDVLALIESILRSPHSTSATKDFAINSLVKLSTRFQSSSIDRIRQILRFFSRSLDTELQQRSVEYSNMFNFESLRPALLERMPVLISHIDEINPNEGVNNYNGDGAEEEVPLTTASAPIPTTATTTASSKAAAATSSATAGSGADSLLDLLGGGFDSHAPALSTNNYNYNNSNNNNNNNNNSSLLDMLGSGAPISATPSVPPASSSTAAAAAAAAPSLLDMMGDFTAAPSFAPSSTTNNNSFPSIIAFEKNGIKITFDLRRNPNGSLGIHVTSSNASGIALSGFVFQAAAPKSVKLTMLEPTGTDLPHGGNITQEMIAENPTQRPLRLKIKINFVANGTPREVLDEVSNFPPNFV